MTGFPVPVPGWFHVGSKIVVNAGIPSAEAVGHPLVAYLQNIVPAGIPSLEAVGTPGILRGPIILRPTGIPSEERFGTLVNQNGDFATDLSHWGTAPGRTVWDGTDGHDALGSVKIIGNGSDMASLQGEDTPALPGQSVSLSAWIKAPGVTSSPGTGGYVWTATLDASHSLIEFGPNAGFNPTNVPTNWTKFVTPAYVLPAGTAYIIIGCNIDGSVVGNVWFDDVALVRSDVKLTYFVAPTGIPSAAAFGVPTVVPGVTTLIPSGIPSEEAFGTPTLTAVVKPTGIPSGEAFGTAAVLPGPVTLVPTGIASAEALGTPVVTLTSPSVLFDALGAGNSQNVQQTNMTISHTATPGSKVIVWIAYANSAGVASMAATYAGQPMTAEGPGLYVGPTSYYNFLQCFSYPAALSGPQNIVFTAGYTSFMKANSISYANANMSDVPKTNTGTGTALSVPSVASALRHLVSNAMLTPAAVAALTAYNQTSRWNVITGAWPTPFLIGDASGAATVSFSANQASSAIWGGEAMDLWNAPVYLVGSAAALANTVAFPAHQVGDLLVVCCIDVVSTTGVTKPAAGGTVPAWVDIETLNTAGGSIRIAQFKATGTNHTTGSWGTASQCYMAVAVVRGQNITTPVGGHGSASATSANSTAPAITLAQNDGSSLILCFHHIRLNYVLGAAPAGYSRRALDPSQNRICLNTKNNSTTDGAIANPCTGSDFTIASQIEIVR
jgi:hypothetical protein